MVNAKQYLKQIKRIDNLIDIKEREVNALRETATRITANLSGDRVSGSSGDTLGLTVAKICDLQSEINEQIDKLVECRAKIRRELDRMNNSEHQKLLYLRYFQFMTWDEIAGEMAVKDAPFSLRWVHMLHDRALKEFQEIIEKTSQ